MKRKGMTVIVLFITMVTFITILTTLKGTANNMSRHEMVLNTPKSIKAGALLSDDYIIGKMRFIPKTGPDGFLQGSAPEELGHNGKEKRFNHILTRNFAVMETEVTRAMWNDLKKMNPNLPEDPTDTRFSGSMKHPVQNNTWYEALLFANLLSIQNGLTPCYYTDATKKYPIDLANYDDGYYYCDFDSDGYRLPTEGEWEYFARATSTSPFPIPRDEDDDPVLFSYAELKKAAVFSANNNFSTAAAGEREGNLWNIKDTIGNVAEWCWDVFDYYPNDTVTDYYANQIDNPNSCRAIRGGYWNSIPEKCRSAFRNSYHPNYRHNNNGFRLVRTL